MYAAAINKSIIAIHDDEEVIKKFKMNLKKEYNKDCVIGKLNKDYYDNMADSYDYYLVRYGDKYIQAKYIDILDRNDKQSLYDLNYAKDILLRLLEFEKSDKRRKKISDVILIISESIDEITVIPPSVQTIESMDELDREYRNKLYD